MGTDQERAVHALRRALIGAGGSSDIGLATERPRNPSVSAPHWDRLARPTGPGLLTYLIVPKVPKGCERRPGVTMKVFTPPDGTAHGTLHRTPLEGAQLPALRMPPALSFYVLRVEYLVWAGSPDRLRAQDDSFLKKDRKKKT